MLSAMPQIPVSTLNLRTPFSGRKKAACGSHSDVVSQRNTTRPPAPLLQMNNTRLFHGQIILHRADPVYALHDFTRSYDGVLRVNPTAQMDDAVAGFNTDLE
jgi:hypothetical protein